MKRSPTPVAAAVGLALALGTAPPSHAEAPGSGVTRVSRLQGSASLGRNRDVVGATVLVREEAQTSHVYVTASDSKGRFRIDGLPDGDYRVEIRREGLRPVVKEGVELRFPSRAVIEVTMEPSDPDGAAPPRPTGGAPLEGVPSISVNGEIAERDGPALPDVRLRFVRADGRADPVVVTSGENGSFALPELPRGRWRLETRAVGFLPIWVVTEFAEDLQLTVSMVPQPAGYDPSPLELMPPEQPIPPARFRRDAPEAGAQPAAEVAERGPESY